MFDGLFGGAQSGVTAPKTPSGSFNGLFAPERAKARTVNIGKAAEQQTLLQQPEMAAIKNVASALPKVGHLSPQPGPSIASRVTNAVKSIPQDTGGAITATNRELNKAGNAVAAPFTAIATGQGGKAVSKAAQLTSDVSGGSVNQFASAVKAVPQAVSLELKNKPINAVEQKVFKSTDPVDVAKKIVGSTIGTGAFLAGFSRGKDLVEGGESFGKGLAKSATTGGAFNVGSQLTNKPNSSVKQLAIAGGEGVVAGGVLHGAGTVASEGLNTLKTATGNNKGVNDLINNTRTKSVQNHFPSPPDVSPDLSSTSIKTSAGESVGRGSQLVTKATNYFKNPDKATADYQAHTMQEFGTSKPNIVSSDSAKHIVNGVGAKLSPDESVPYHAPAKGFTDNYYKQLLVDPATKNQPVMFTGGGSGAGKTFALKASGENLNKYAAVYDGNLRSFESSKTKIDQALHSGRPVTINYVYRDPVEAFKNGVLSRAGKTGRTVPIDIHADTHVDSLATIQKLAQHYDGNPNVKIKILDNTDNTVTKQGLDFLADKGYNKDQLIGRLHDELTSAHQTGKISTATHDATRASSKSETNTKPDGVSSPSGRNVPADAERTKQGASRSLSSNEAGGIPVGEVVGNVQDMLAKHQAVQKATGDIEHDYAVNQGNAKDVKLDTAKVLKNRAPLSASDKQTIQNYRDAKAIGQKPDPLPAHLQEADDNITALNKAAQANDAAKARLTGDEAKAQSIEARDPETYTHRIAQGKGSKLELTARGDTDNPLSVGSLSKTTAGSKKQVYQALTDEDGNRRVVAIKNKVLKDENGGKTIQGKQVTAMRDSGTVKRPLGTLNLKSNADRMQTELKPVQNKIDSLEREQKILSATKSRSSAASVRLNNLESNLQDAYREHATITNKYATDDLEGKSFVAKDGKKYTIGQATQDEITKATGQKYYVDPELTSTLNYADSKVSLENTRFVENTKSILEDKQLAYKEGETAPKNFQPTTNPYFRGYKLDPKLAEQLNDITGNSKDGLDLFNKTGKVLKQTIVYLPIKHNFNEIAGYVIDRGLSKLLNPAAYFRMGKSLGVGMKSVATHDDLYRQILQKGGNLMGADDTQLGKVVAKQVRALTDDSPTIVKVAKALGSSPKRMYNAIQHVSVYDVQDVLNIARVNERMQGGLFSKGQNLDDAIKTTERYNLQYKVPSRALLPGKAGRSVSNVLRSDKVYFGAYTYDKARIAGNILKDTTNLAHPKEALQAADKLAATVFIASVLWPQVDKGLQDITGDKNAHITAPGVSSVVETAQKVAQGKETPTAAAGSQLSVSAPVSIGSQLLGNTNSFTGAKISDPNASLPTRARQTFSFLKSQLAPNEKLSTVKNASANKGLSTFLSLAGASLPKNSPGDTKLESLKYDSLPFAQSEAKALAAKGNIQGSIARIAAYNAQVTKTVQAAAKEDGKPIPTSAQIKSMGYYYDPKLSTVQGWAKTKPSTGLLSQILSTKTAPKKGTAAYGPYEQAKKEKAAQTKIYNEIHPKEKQPVLTLP